MRQQAHNRSLPRLLGSSGLLLLLVFLAASAAPNKPVAMQAGTTILTARPLDIPTLASYATWMAPAKRAVLEQIDNDRATMVALRNLTATPIPWAQRQSEPAQVTREPLATAQPGGRYHAAGAGILVDGSGASFNSSGCLAQNGWSAAMPGGLTHVYAGALGSNAGADRGWGVAAVAEMLDVDRSLQLIGTYLTPYRVGAVHIVGAEGWRLQVATLDGSATFYFDVTARQWLTATPSASPSPAQSPLPSPSP